MPRSSDGAIPVTAPCGVPAVMSYALQALAAPPSPLRGAPDRVRVWTDDYTSIVPLLRWW